ncbi:MAG: HprK-related kinase B [Candidatus Eisenbacteria bacterium]
MTKAKSHLRALDVAAGIVPTERGLHELDLAFGEFGVRVFSNAKPLLHRLDRYYQAFLSPARPAPDLVIHAIERPTARLPLAFREWPREPGKRGRKEEWANLDGGRVVRKIRTGMQFLIGPDYRIAFGPCQANDNQIVNFINTQYINHHLHRGWVLGHAAAVAARDGAHSIVFAASSGGGKSTLALHLLSAGAGFVSNDRVLLKRHGDGVLVRGVPKLPRVNPGTIINNPKLLSLLSTEKVESLRSLSREELWQLEEKYDVDLKLTFSGTRYIAESMVQALVVLDWDRRVSLPTELRETTYEECESAFSAIRKGPGPFYFAADGSMPSGPVEPEAEVYRTALEGLPVLQLEGGVEFEKAASRVADLLGLGAE